MNAVAREPLPLLSPPEPAGLPMEEREDYDEARMVWHGRVFRPRVPRS